MRLRDSASTLSLFELASGGMGRVELVAVREATFLRLYACKRLLPQFRDDPEFRAMFVDEARVAGLLRHANVVSVLDVDEDDDGPYLLMDFVEGVSLAQVIVRSQEANQRLPVQMCAKIAAQMARGLHAAHEATTADGKALGLIHRDISPQNVIVGYDGIVRVTDFGIARAEGRSSATTTGLLKGKPGYLSPEQLRFEKPDRRSDLFALGVVLWEMLAGERLYAATDEVGAAYRTLNDPPADFGEIGDDIPPALVELGFELLAKDPGDRPQTARDIARRLDAIVADLAATEGPFELAEYMESEFAEQRAKQRARIAERLAALDSAPEERPSLVLWPGEATPAEETKPLGPFARELSATRRFRLLPAIGGAALLAVVIGGVFAMRRPGSSESVSPTAPASGVTLETSAPIIELSASPAITANELTPDAAASPVRRVRSRRDSTPLPAASGEPKPRSPFENLGARE
jgi:serine/threonine-protein kinase